MQCPDALFDGFFRRPVLLVLLHEPPHCGCVRRRTKDVVGKLSGTDPFQSLAPPTIDTHDLIEGHPLLST